MSVWRWGNVGTFDDLPALQRAAAEEEELVAEHARWGIARIQERGGKPSCLLGESAVER